MQGPGALSVYADEGLRVETQRFGRRPAEARPAPSDLGVVPCGDGEPLRGDPTRPCGPIGPCSDACVGLPDSQRLTRDRNELLLRSC